MSQRQRKGPKPKPAPIKEEESEEDSFEVNIDCPYFLSIYKDLNLDDEAAEMAYTSFLKVVNEFTLSPPVTDWYACAIYAACRKVNRKNKHPNRNEASNNSKNVSNMLHDNNPSSSSQNEGNFVSLTRILRSCNISVIRFCKKMTNWSDMVHFDEDMRNKLNQLESSFNVTTAIFKKYKTIFEDVFKCPSAVVPSRFCGKNRKNIKKQALVTNDIYHFCWTMFVFIKSRYSRIKYDIINSYHLLLVCIDHCFGSVLTFDNALDIINTTFYETLAKRYGKDPKQYQMDSGSPSKICIIDLLCEKFTGRPVEVKEIKKHWINQLIKKMIEEKKIKKKENGYGIIDTEVIDGNFRCFKQIYEQFVLSGGDFDECVFLNDNASRELGTDELSQSVEINEAFQNLSQRSNHDNPNNLLPMTPLTTKQYIPHLALQNSLLAMTPVTSATQNVSRLQTILNNQLPMPSERLKLWCNKLGNNILENIATIITRMGDVFVEKYNIDEENKQEVIIRNTDMFCYILTEQIEKRRDSAVAFFYYILEKIVIREVDRNVHRKIAEADFLPNIERLFERNIFFVQSLFVISLEIIVFTYKLRKYDYVFDVFNDVPDVKIHPFYVYKVIEPIIREEPNFHVDLVKHLSSIEEKIQDSLAWDLKSPIWNYLASRKGKAPTCQEVSLKNLTSAPSTPIKSEFGNLLLTPKKAITNNTVPQPNPTVQALQTRPMDPPQSPINNSNNRGASSAGFNLFFRKVYQLASVRLMNLCDRLDIKLDELRILMWTCLENAISQHCELLADRNLDQLIMCALYSVNAINRSTTGADIKFHDIINAYSKQPQANKLVYRRVLLTNRDVFDNNNQPQAIDSNVCQDKYATIIEFYNKVFLVKIGNDYLLKFNLRKNSPPMSPIPNRMHAPTIQSPIRQIPNSQIFVSPLRKTDRLNSPLAVMSFPIENGTNLSHNLSEINRLINSHRDAEAANTMLMITQDTNIKRATKRIFQDEDKDVDVPSPSKSCSLTRRIQSMVNERKFLSKNSANNSTNPSSTDDSSDSQTLLSNKNNTQIKVENNDESLAPPPCILSSPPIVTVNNA